MSKQTIPCRKIALQHLGVKEFSGLYKNNPQIVEFIRHTTKGMLFPEKKSWHLLFVLVCVHRSGKTVMGILRGIGWVAEEVLQKLSSASAKAAKKPDRQKPTELNEKNVPPILIINVYNSNWSIFSHYRRLYGINQGNFCIKMDILKIFVIFGGTMGNALSIVISIFLYHWPDYIELEKELVSPDVKTVNNPAKRQTIPIKNHKTCRT